MKKQGETSYKKTSFGIIPRSQLILLEIEGVKKIWDFITKKYKKKDILITPDFIKEIHKIGFAWIFPKEGGNFRDIEVSVSDHKPPEYYLIPQLIDSYCKDLAERLRQLSNTNKIDFINELISVLAWLHHKFLWIHPFTDYNGRISRLLINVALLNLNLPPIELKVETKTGRNKYIQALKNADNGSFLDLEKLISEAIEETTKELISYDEKHPNH